MTEIIAIMVVAGWIGYGVGYAVATSNKEKIYIPYKPVTKEEAEQALSESLNQTVKITE